MARSTYNCARIRIMLTFILIPMLLVQQCKSLNAVPVKVIEGRSCDDHHMTDFFLKHLKTDRYGPFMQSINGNVERIK